MVNWLDFELKINVINRVQFSNRNVMRPYSYSSIIDVFVGIAFINILLRLENVS